MINSINSSTNSVQLLQSNQPTSPAQLNRQAIQPTSPAQQDRQAAQAQQVQSAQQPQATVNTSGQTIGANLNVVA